MTPIEALERIKALKDGYKGSSMGRIAGYRVCGDLAEQALRAAAVGANVGAGADLEGWNRAIEEAARTASSMPYTSRPPEVAATIRAMRADVPVGAEVRAETEAEKINRQYEDVGPQD